MESLLKRRHVSLDPTPSTITFDTNMSKKIALLVVTLLI